jgi:hypothetical protein
MRKRVSIAKMMVGGKMVRIKHIDGIPVELQRTSNSQRSYVHKRPIHGCGWLDTIIGGITHLFGGSVKPMSPKAIMMENMAGAEKKMSREQLLGEISKSMTSRRGRK